MITKMKLSLGPRVGAALLVGLAAVMTPAPADAAGLLFDATTLPAKTRDALRADLEQARKDVPALFAQVQDIAAHAGELDEGSRVRGAPLTMPLKALGPRALMPMLELLAFDAAKAPKDLTPTAARALRLGLVEAVGIVRDARAVPVLSGVLGREREVDTVRATAEALGRIGTDEALAVVSGALDKARATKDADRERALLDGAGGFKRLGAAKLLAATLAAKTDEATAKVAAKALGSVGNAWAWSTLTDRSEEAATREVAGRALAFAVIAYGGEARSAIEKAILVVDAPAMKTYLGEARRGANADQLAVLDAVAKKLASNPAR